MIYRNNDSDLESIIVECDCYSGDHNLKLSRWKGEKEVYVTLTMIPRWRTIWGRMKLCFLYMFGVRPLYNYDEIVCNSEDVDEIAKFLNKGA